MFKLRSLMYAIFISIMMHNVHAESIATTTQNIFAEEMELAQEINELMQDRLIDFGVTYYYEIKELNKMYIHNKAEGDRRIANMWNAFKQTGALEEAAELILEKLDIEEFTDEEKEEFVTAFKQNIDESALMAIKQQYYLASIIYNRVHNTTEKNI